MSAGAERRGPTLTAERKHGAAATPAVGPEREAQEKLACLLRWIDAWEAELAGIYATLPVPDPAEADAMEEGERPESLGHRLRTTIECLRIDWLPHTRAILACAVASRGQGLEREWCAMRAAGRWS